MTDFRLYDDARVELSIHASVVVASLSVMSY